MAIKQAWKGLLLVLALSMPSAAWAEGLVDTLVSQLGVTQEQASGGAGALLGYAQQSLGEGDWSQLVSLVPEASSLAGAADLGAKKGFMSSLMGLFGGSGDSGVSMANVVEAFAGLNLDAATIAKFTPIVLDYVKQQGGGELVQTLAGLWTSPVG